jgi:outer membrane receptor protein involved in Fe transport
MSRYPNAFSLVSAAVVAAIAGAAVAAPQEQDTAQRAEYTIALEEVVVTARKREESLQEVPVAVSAFTAETLEERQILSVNDVARFTPGLVFDKAFGRSTDRPVIRGQGNVLAGVQFGVEAGAAYFVDGIYYPGDIQSLDLSSLERVEVIRGPQSALYGRNTYSGAINFVTRAPSKEISGSAKASIDEDEKDYSLRLEGPIVEGRLGASLTLRRNRFDGQWINEATGQTIGQESTDAIAGVIEWTPTDNLRIRGRASYNQDRDGTRPFTWQDPTQNNCYPGTRSLAYYATSGSTNANQYYCGEIQAGRIFLNDAPVTNVVPNASAPANLLSPTAPGTAPLAGQTSRLYDTRQGIAFSGVNRNLRYFSALADWDIGGSGYRLVVDGAIRGEDTLTGSDSEFSSVNWFQDRTGPTGTTFRFPNDPTVGGEALGANTGAAETDDWSFEAKIESPADRNLRWMLGVFHYEQEQRSYDVNFLFPRGQDLPFSISDVNNSAVFGLVEWKFTPAWSVTAEGRYAEEEKGVSEWSVAAPLTASTAAAAIFSNSNRGAQTFSGTAKFTKFTPRVTVKWQPTNDLNFYAVYAEGVKPGGLNGAAGLLVPPPGEPRPTYDQETSDNIELGMKSAWLDGRLVFNLAGFFIKADGVQLTTPIFRTDGSAVTSIATNQGNGEIRGVEVESRWRVFDPLTLSLTYALADSEFTEGVDDFQWTLTSGGGNSFGRPGAYNPANPAAGGTNLNGRGDASIVGNPFPLSAKHTASFAADFRTALNETVEFFASADVSYTGKRVVQVHEDPYVPAATLVGARIGFSNENWSASLYGRNLTNEDAVAIATRWFSQPYIGFSTSGFAAATPLRSGTSLAAAGLPAYPPANGIATAPPTGTALNSVASYSLPRGFFAALRRERQVGIEVSYKF